MPKNQLHGELHEGTEVLIFVTEEYNIDKQVKKEMKSNDASASILKLNRINRFTTGIYDYSMMTSVFKATDMEKYPNAFKVTSTAQDWCGHTWTNLTWGNMGYKQSMDSYFESEVGEPRDIGKAMSEDELLSLIRMNPDALPTGKFRMIPSINYARFSHKKLSPEECSGRVEVNNDSSTYILSYTSGRELTVHFESAFPYKITGWEEKRKSGYGANEKWLTTTAKLKKSILSDYWSKHDVDDAPMRNLLGL